MRVWVCPSRPSVDESVRVRPGSVLLLAVVMNENELVPGLAPGRVLPLLGGTFSGKPGPTTPFEDGRKLNWP